ALGGALRALLLLAGVRRAIALGVPAPAFELERRLGHDLGKPLATAVGTLGRGRVANLLDQLGQLLALLADVLVDGHRRDRLKAEQQAVQGVPEYVEAMSEAPDPKPPKDLEARVRLALETVRPMLQSDGGDIVLLGVTADLKARVQMVGACRT